MIILRNFIKLYFDCRLLFLVLSCSALVLEILRMFIWSRSFCIFVCRRLLSYVSLFFCFIMFFIIFFILFWEFYICINIIIYIYNIINYKFIKKFCGGGGSYIFFFYFWNLYINIEMCFWFKKKIVVEF